MTPGDLGGFMEAFRGLQRVFPLRGSDFELQDLGASYFRAMRRYPLGAVMSGAELWIERGQRFPKPAEWMGAIPPRTQETTLVELTADEVREYREAERLIWEGQPCLCSECVRAGIDEKPLRYVPELDADGRDVHALDGEKTVTRGHWAHGDELARWYLARGNFWNRCYELGLMDRKDAKKIDKLPFAQRLERLFVKRPMTTAPPLKLVPSAPETAR